MATFLGYIEKIFLIYLCHTLDKTAPDFRPKNRTDSKFPIYHRIPPQYSVRYKLKIAEDHSGDTPCTYRIRVVRVLVCEIKENSEDFRNFFLESNQNGL